MKDTNIKTLFYYSMVDTCEVTTALMAQSSTARTK